MIMKTLIDSSETLLNYDLIWNRFIIEKYIQDFIAFTVQLYIFIYILYAYIMQLLYFKATNINKKLQFI